MPKSESAHPPPGPSRVRATSSAPCATRWSACSSAFEHGWPRWPAPVQSATASIMVPELDVRENANAITIEAELPGVDEKDVRSRSPTAC